MQPAQGAPTDTFVHPGRAKTARADNARTSGKPGEEENTVATEEILEPPVAAENPGTRPIVELYEEPSAG